MSDPSLEYAYGVERDRREALEAVLEEREQLLIDLALEGRINGWDDPVAEVHDPTGVLSRVRHVLRGRGELT